MNRGPTARTQPDKAISVTVATVLLPPPRLVRCSMLTVGGIP
jgi:hypothetical protein